MKIGVFDSGVGGLAFVNSINNSDIHAEVIFKNDSKHLPYGDKTPKELYNWVLPILKSLQNDGCEVIVVACNTVTTNIINDLRQKINVPLIGVEPMIKPAAELTKSKTIAVCATPATLASKRYAELKDTYAKSLKVLEPDCSDWTAMIESKEMDHQKLQAQIEDVCKNGADVIVLGCTHYHWIEEDIKKVASGRATIIQPELSVIENLKKVLEQNL